MMGEAAPRRSKACTLIAEDSARGRAHTADHERFVSGATSGCELHHNKNKKLKLKMAETRQHAVIYKLCCLSAHLVPTQLETIVGVRDGAR